MSIIISNNKIYDTMWDSLHHNVKCTTVDKKTYYGYVSNVESRVYSDSSEGEIFVDIEDDVGRRIKESEIETLTILDEINDRPFLDVKHIRENAMDLLIMEEFICNEQFRIPFIQESSKLSVFCKNEYRVEKAFHSLSNYDGESDIIFVLNASGIRFSIFIEDKINAITMEEQSNRYEKRALSEDMREILGHNGENFEIFLVAPQDYIKEHQNDPNASYEHCISYEVLQQCFVQQNDTRSLFKYHVIQSAISKEKYNSVVVNDNVTDFWKQLDVICSEYCLEIINPYQDRGADSVWIRFKTNLKKVQLVYKARQGYIDLQFKDYSEKLEELRGKIGSRLEENMHLIAVSKTAKSAAIRIADENWKIDLRNPFSMYIDVIPAILNNVKKLEQIANSLSYYDLYK